MICPFCFVNQSYSMCNNCVSLNSFDNNGKLFSYQFEIDIEHKTYFIQYNFHDNRTNIYKAGIEKIILSFNGNGSLTPKNANKKLPILLTFS